jgi:hypothetical protein
MLVLHEGLDLDFPSQTLNHLLAQFLHRYLFHSRDEVGRDVLHAEDVAEPALAQHLAQFELLQKGLALSLPV